MEEGYIDPQDPAMNDVVNRGSDGNENIDVSKDFGDINYDENYDDDEGGNGFRGGRGRGNFRGRGRGPPPGWMNGPPPNMRFRGRGYGPGGPPMRGRGFFRGRGGPRYGPNNGPNFDNNWGPMGPPPPGMMGGPPPFGPPPGMMGPGGPMGPPPNMMGQPPFGGPPGMPPPNMPVHDLWVETKTDEGKSYYYHSRTRDTTWTRPQEGPTCKVITQAEMEALAAVGQVPGPQPMGMGANMGPGPGMGPGAGMGQGAGMGPPGSGMGPPGSGMGPPGSGMGPPGSGMGPPGSGMGPPGSGMGPPGSGMGPPGSGMGPPGSGMGPPGSGMGPNPGLGIPGSQPPGLPPFMTQPPPWVKEGSNKETKADGAVLEEGDEAPPGEGSPALQPPNGAMSFPAHAAAPGAFPAGAPPGFPPAAFPGAPPGFNPSQPPGMNFPGGWGGWGGWPPPLVQQPRAALGQPVAATPAPDTGAAAGAGAAGGAGDAPALAPPKEITVIPPELAAAAAEWSAHRAPDGRPYYYHAARQESVWEKPKPMKDLEELQDKIAEEKGEKPEKKEEESRIEVIDVEAHAEAQAAAEEAAARRAEEAREREAREQAAREQQAREQQARDREDREREKAKRENKPVSIMPISGTPWCLVWSGDGRMFYYNPTTNKSVWDRPEQLVGRADVDRATHCPPAAVTQYFQRKEAATPTPTPTKPANGELKRSADSDSDDSDSEPIKKAKPDEAAATTAAKKTPISSSLIDAGKEARKEAEARAARQRAVVPLEQRVRAFRQMLQDRDVSAFSTWEKELKKIVADERYLLLTSEERKQVFNKYVRERAEEERAEKKNKLLQKKNAFKELMDEAKLHSKSSFNEFSSRHGRDDRFKGIDKARDRLAYFTEHVAELRKKEKDDKDKKREQAKTDFIALLKEKTVDRRARWPDAKKKVDSDARYKAVESSTLREDYFREYCKLVKGERKKDKDKDTKEKERDRSSSKKEKKDKERDKDKEKDKDKDKDKDKERDKEVKEGKKEKKKEKGEKAETAATEEERKQPTPPPDQWADILGIPGKADKKKQPAPTSTDSETSEEQVCSPKQLRSSKKELPTPEKKQSPKKRKPEKSPEPEKKLAKKPIKNEKKRKKSEKE